MCWFYNTHLKKHIICTNIMHKQVCAASRRLATEWWNSVKHRVAFFCCHFCAKAGIQITPFDLGTVFHLSASIKVPQPEIQCKETQGRECGPLGRESRRKPLEELHWRASTSSYWLHIRAQDHPKNPLCVTSRQCNMSCSLCGISPAGRRLSRAVQLWKLAGFENSYAIVFVQDFPVFQ